ncbi:MAG: c-type cytochrome, partial [Acidiferrobacterales bacterium]|nr:c-type cytochrome [Acidiferrobacterales bacterium]
MLILVLIFSLAASISNPALAAHDGKHLFFQYCAACHGFEGNGGMGVPLSLPDFLATASDDYLAKSIRHGRPGRVMPAFTDLTQHEIDMIVRYIRSWSKSSAPVYSAGHIKGDVEKGKTLFGNNCAACHGDHGQGGPGTGVTMSRPRSLPILAPALNNSGFLASAPDEMIKATLVNGRKGTPMISFLDQGMNEQDINDIVAYIRSFESTAT